MLRVAPGHRRRRRVRRRRAARGGVRPRRAARLLRQLRAHRRAGRPAARQPARSRWPACCPTRRSSPGAGGPASWPAWCCWRSAPTSGSRSWRPRRSRGCRRARRSRRLPLRDLLAAQPKRLLLGMGTRFIEGFTFNFFSVYLLAYVVTTLELPRSLALGGVMVGAALGVVLVPITGRLSRPVRPQAGLPGRARGSRWSSRSRSPRWCSPRDHARPSSRCSSIGLGLLYGIDLRPAGGVLVRAVRHPLPLHGAEHALPDLRDRGLRPHAADRHLAGRPRRRQPVAGRGLQRARGGDQPRLRAPPAGDAAAATSTSRSRTSRPAGCLEPASAR